MIPRLYHAPFRLLVSAQVHQDARLTFSSSAVSFARRIPQHSAGEHAVGRRSRETEDEAEENKSNTSEEDAQLDRWLLAGEERVNESAVRSYKDPYGHFCKTVAPSFREPSPRKWLGRDVPFPLNPSFKPPPALSDDFRTRLYQAYMSDPKLNSVRTLAIRYNISIKRVDAILRLKGMEQAWKKNKTLQSGFTKGMEHLLGAETPRFVGQDANELSEDAHIGESPRQGNSHDRYDVEEADSQDEIEGIKARQRYQRLFWESVAEGEEPVMSSILAGQHSTTSTRAKVENKARLVERAPGRPAIMFIDVGDAFVDKKEKERREREGARRSALKARRRIREHA